MLEVVEGARALLEHDRRAWTTKSRAARGYACWQKRKCRWEDAVDLHNVPACDRRAAQWSATGAVERAAGGQEEWQVAVVLELVLGLTGASLSRIENDHRRQGAITSLGLAARVLEALLGVPGAPPLPTRVLLLPPGPPASTPVEAAPETQRSVAA